MAYTPDILEELEILNLFDISNNQEGIKVHKSARLSAIDAARRLHEKGLLTQVDGGYLTRLGQEAAEHAQALNTILSAG